MAVLLIVEDDVATNEAICEYMKSAGHTTCLPLMGNRVCRLRGNNLLI